MAKRMLVDASHPEETRVAIVSGNRLEELDFETSNKAQLKGNIYLAKVTRVEPSLQAAFVDYGGNRHGFLAFSEIHPDYYKLPIADRKKLLAEEAAIVQGDDDTANGGDEAAEGNGAEPDAESRGSGRGGRGGVEVVGGDEIDEMDSRRRRRTDRYKIQEVVKRRQILLVQVVKEERGNKGAALTTYISLAGRYCVLMPNTARGGGVSRKITNATDRRRLKRFVEDLDIPDGMAVIVRTAGEERSKAEIRRDYEYLARTWEEIRSTTLQSTAPALIHEEANLIKRSIRDLYSRDIDEILVEGADGYRLAKDFMRKLTPSHAKRVQPYRDETIPLFHRYQVESQIDDIHGPDVQLKSGGYIVINPTEALVSIDVNSGKATKERHIEETAYKTNLEAAEEIARQLRLRDLAGLIVIDFIDMEESRNQSGVERRLKDALRADRARIQVGRISPFGLLEMSRQRLRPSLIETSTQPCTHCNGAGFIRSTESMALHVLRAIEEEGIRQRSQEITAYVPTSAALYVLNQKREILADIERRYGFNVLINADESLVPPDMRIERTRGAAEDGGEPVEAAAAVEGERDEDGKERRRRRSRRKGRDGAGERTETRVEPEEAAPAGEGGPAQEARPDDEGEEQPRRRRRRGRRGGRRRSRERGETTGETAAAATDGKIAGDGEAAGPPADDTAPSETATADHDAGVTEPDQPPAEMTAADDTAPTEPVDKKEKRPRRPRKTKAKTAKSPKTAKPAEPADAAEAQGDGGDAEPGTADTPAGQGDLPLGEAPPPEAPAFAPPASASLDAAPAETQGAPETAPESEPSSPRRGWWRRLTEE